ncbi:MAG: DUF1611 domain-containing protein [Bacteroidetes bacterium]|nr:MAG: DUF1611 domain-containing protein [Bacteroidota bacterium]
MDGTAVVFTHQHFQRIAGKTAHGLIRGTERYRILAVIDSLAEGHDAGTLLDGTPRGIPVVGSLSDYLAQAAEPPDYLILGIATHGGRLPEEWMPLLKDALRAGISIVNGLHEFLTDFAELVAMADQYHARLIDVRKPKPREQLHFWSGAIHSVRCPKIPVIGTDCAVGKRTTARMLVEACRAAGLRAEMIYTGQTGWMQGWRYGFIFDATLNDFVAGELEHAIVRCYEEVQPDVIFIEGQAALRNPSGPCGSELLVSCAADGVVLVHPPGRTHFEGWEHLPHRLPDPRSECALIRLYGSEPLGLALNTQGLSLAEAQAWQARYQDELALPVVLPIEEGVAGLLPHIQALIKGRRS